MSEYNCAVATFPIGVVVPSGSFEELEQLRALAEVIETNGVAALYLQEQPGLRIDPYVLLAELAQRHTEMVLGVVQPLDGARAPSVLANVLSGLNVVSDGRGALALGDFDDPHTDVVATMNEALIILQLMMQNDETTYVGEHFVVERAWNTPRVSVTHSPFVEIMPVLSRAQWIDELDHPSSLRGLAARIEDYVFCEASGSSPTELQALVAHVHEEIAGGEVIGAIAATSLVETIEQAERVQESGCVGVLLRWHTVPAIDELDEYLRRVGDVLV